MFAKDLILGLLQCTEDDLYYSRMWSLFRAENINHKIFDSKDFSAEIKEKVKEYDPGSEDFLKRLEDPNQFNEDFWRKLYVSIVNSQGTFISFWKELFYKLYDASEDQTQDSHMWKLFRKDEIKINKEVFSSVFFNDFHRFILEQYDLESEDFLSIQLKEDIYLDDLFWLHLFIIIRDQGCQKIDVNARLQVNCSGELLNMSLAEAESHIIRDFGDIFHTQISVPGLQVQNVAKEDMLKELRIEEDKRKFNLKVKESEKKKSLEVIREEMKLTSKSQELQKVQANEGEFIVHEHIIEAVKEEGITVAVFREGFKKKKL